MASAEWSPERIKYLTLLAEKYPNMKALYTEIINIGAILNLPKGTEHFMSDIHGEYESFTHIMNNCSGVIREKVELWLGDDLTGREISELCTLIYYPEEKLRLLKKEGTATPDWYRITLLRMIRLARLLSSKHTRAKVRQTMPQEYAYILDELLHAQDDEDSSQQRYHSAVVSTLIDIGAGDDFISTVASLIKRLAVDHLHVVGDIFDRGPRADSIMDILMDHYSIDIEWGNHDVLWMGAASGSLACIAGVVRNCLSYNNTEILENGYGISLRPLVMLAARVYPEMDNMAACKLLITLLMFKLEGQLILRHPDWNLDDRLLLDKIDREAHTVETDGRVWAVKDIPMPTVFPEDPYALSEAEEQVMNGLKADFLQSQRLHRHIEFLYTHGRVYRCFNDNLLFHGCVPLNSEGGFLVRTFDGQETVSGRSLMDYCDTMARKAFYHATPEALDFMWYLWCGDDSPMCGRKIKTFARFFIEDKESWAEPRNPYYVYVDQESTCLMILEEFGLTGSWCRIINGHTPIRVTHGESPLKAGGRLVVIDGGFCKAYQKTTGIAGYTLIANSHGLRIKSHQPFTTLEDALEKGRDIRSSSLEFANYDHRRLVKDTDEGVELMERIEDLKDLLNACKAGAVRLRSR